MSGEPTREFHRSIRKNIFRYIAADNIQMITYVVSSNVNVINMNNVNTFITYALAIGKHLIADIFRIYRKNASNIGNICIYDAVDYTIEGCMRLMYLNLLSDDILGDNAYRCNIANVTLLKSSQTYNFGTLDNYYLDAIGDGHAYFIQLLPLHNMTKAEVFARGLHRNYKNVAKYCVQHNIRMSGCNYTRHYFNVNDSTLLLLDNDLIDYKCFNKQAIRELIKRGYSIKK